MQDAVVLQGACRGGMLCGEILRSPQQCLSVVPLGVGVGQVNSPYLALLAMATLTAMDADNDDIFLGESACIQ